MNSFKYPDLHSTKMDLTDSHVFKFIIRTSLLAGLNIKNNSSPEFVLPNLYIPFDGISANISSQPF